MEINTCACCAFAILARSASGIKTSSSRVSMTRYCGISRCSNCRNSLATCKTTVFSSSPVGPMAPGSCPPCPGSMQMRGEGLALEGRSTLADGRVGVTRGTPVCAGSSVRGRRRHRTQQLDGDTMWRRLHRHAIILCALQGQGDPHAVGLALRHLNGLQSSIRDGDVPLAPLRRQLRLRQVDFQTVRLGEALYQGLDWPAHRDDHVSAVWRRGRPDVFQNISGRSNHGSNYRSRRR